MTPGTPDDDIESDHMEKCPVCGKTFDMRNLEEVLEHIHDGPEMPMVILPSGSGEPD